jgi:hypothetical protein
VRGLADIEKLTLQRKHSIVVPADDTEAGNSERLGGVAFGKDKGAVLALSSARKVRIVELGDADKLGALGAAFLLQLGSLLEL